MVGILKRLLIATDGSDNAERALEYGIALGRRHESELVLCSAVDRAGSIAECSTSNSGFEFGMTLATSLEDNAAAILASAEKRVAVAGLPVTSVVVDGRFAHAIVACAIDHNVDAIVLGSQGKTGLDRFFLGSTAEDVLRRADVPVFVVPRDVQDVAATLERIVVGVDDSDPGDAASAFAIDLARSSAATLIFCGVVEKTSLLENAATLGYETASMANEVRDVVEGLLLAHMERARALGIGSESVLDEGAPIDRILSVAHTREAALIVVGTHGRRGLARLFVGSVAEGIVRRSTVPVAVMRASHLRAAMDLAPSARRNEVTSQLA